MTSPVQTSPSTETPVLSVEDLGKVYTIKKKGRTKLIEALKGVSFTAQPGEIIGIVGPSRSGKSTLLRIIAGVSRPTSGRVSGHGRVFSLLNPGTSFNDEDSATRNARDTAMLFGMPREFVDEKIDSILRFANLEEFRDVPVKRYSRGMRLRLAFAVAIALEPDIFAGDDVLGVGDLDFQERCIQRLQERAAAGGLVFFVSHDPPTLARLCTRLLWMDGGNLIRSGPTGGILDEYAESAARVAGANILHLNRGASFNDDCRILSVRLVGSEGDPIEEAARSDTVGIAVEFEMLTDGREPRCAVDLFVRGGLAFRSEADAVLLPPGKYLSTAWIPGHTLAPATHAVRAEITLGERNQVRWKDLSFDVQDEQTPGSNAGWLASFPGRSAPAMDWEFARVERGSDDRAGGSDTAEAPAVREATQDHPQLDAESDR